MRRKRGHRDRRGVTLVEAAVAYPVTFLLIMGTMFGGIGVFCYQGTTHVARETARFASTHGGAYARENAVAIQQGTLPNANEAYLTSYAKGLAGVLDPSQLQISLTFNMPSGDFDWDDVADNNNREPYSTIQVNDQPVTVTNTVTVVATYQWSPGAGLGGPYTLTSTSVMPMSY